MDEIKYLNAYKEPRKRLFHKYYDKNIEYYDDIFIICMDIIIEIKKHSLN